MDRDESKALMKVWPDILHWTQFDTMIWSNRFTSWKLNVMSWGMVVALQAFLEFCYISQHNIHDTTSLWNLEMHSIAPTHCKIFHECIVPMALIYLNNTPLFIMSNSQSVGAPWCVSSITELKHIKAVKEPWWHSNSLLLDRCYLQINGLTNWQPHMSFCPPWNASSNTPIGHYRRSGMYINLMIKYLVTDMLCIYLFSLIIKWTLARFRLQPTVSC